MNKVRTIGLTGVAGSGKSSVRAWLADRGFAHLDADLVARQRLEDAEVVQAVIDTFGARVASRTGEPRRVDRAALAEIVFSDDADLLRLERILHPGVIEATRRWLDEHPMQPRVVEAIKLVESGMSDAVDEVWLVSCDRRERLRRLVARGWSELEAERRLRAARSSREHLADCDLVIDNSGPWPTTETQLEAALRRVSPRRPQHPRRPLRGRS